MPLGDRDNRIYIASIDRQIDSPNAYKSPLGPEEPSLPRTPALF